MKAYLITTASLFSLLALLHIWRLIAERSHAAQQHGFAVGMVLLSVVLAMLSWWGWWLLCKLLRRAAAPKIEATDKQSS